MNKAQEMRNIATSEKAVDEAYNNVLGNIKRRAESNRTSIEVALPEGLTKKVKEMLEKDGFSVIYWNYLGNKFTVSW